MIIFEIITHISIIIAKPQYFDQFYLIDVLCLFNNIFNFPLFFFLAILSHLNKSHLKFYIVCIYSFGFEPFFIIMSIATHMVVGSGSYFFRS